MARREQRRAQPNAGAFMGPDIMVPVPMGTLDDEPRAGDAMEDEQPRPQPRGWLKRIVDRLTMRPR